jgi:hypothetical protein
MPSMDRISKADLLELISPAVSPEVPVAIRAASKEIKVEDPVVEMANPTLCLSVILVLRPNKAALRDSSLSVAPLRLLESPWAMMVELKVLPTLSLSPPRVLKKLSN